jgi:hypothetical protein
MARKRSNPYKSGQRGKADTSRGPGKFLGMPWWTGVGSIATALALVVTLWAVLKPSGNSSEKPAGSSSNNNNATSLASPLSIKSSWPLEPDCDGSTSIAVFPNGPSSQAVRISPTTDVRTTLAGKGAAYGQGFLSLTFTATGNSVVQIMNIRPVIYLESHRMPAWIYAEEGGCGDTYSRYFSLNLDSRTMVDQGVQGVPCVTTGCPTPPTDPLGKSFHVSSTDPAEVIVIAHACKAYYEWGLQITYVIGAQEFVKYIGTQSNPFRSIGSFASAIPAYTSGASNVSRLVRVDTAPKVGCLIIDSVQQEVRQQGRTTARMHDRRQRPLPAELVPTWHAPVVCIQKARSRTGWQGSMRPSMRQRSAGLGRLHSLDVELVDRAVGTPMFRTFSCQMPSVHLVRCSTSPPPEGPWSTVWLSSEYCLDGPPINYWPHVGVKDVQDRSCHRIVDALQAEEALAGGGNSDGAPGSLAPIVP